MHPSGGTFDTAALSCTGSMDSFFSVIVHSHNGEPKLGGEDIDAALVKNIAQMELLASSGFDINDPRNAKAFYKLQDAFRVAKEQLSNPDQSHVLYRAS